MKTSTSHAFSLIEIIVAVSIIVLFITLPVLAYSNYSKRSRDEKRKNDVTKVVQALEQYKAEKGVYPNELEQLVAEGYLPELPKDPQYGQQIPGETEGVTYGYEYKTDGNTYALAARLEEEVLAKDESGNPGGSAPGAFVITQENTSGIEAPIAELTEIAVEQISSIALQPTNLPTSTTAPFASITPTATKTPTPTLPANPATATLTPTKTSTPSPTKTNTPSPTKTKTPTPTKTNTPSPTKTKTPTPTKTSTPSPTKTKTPTPSRTPTPRRCWGINGVCDTACTVKTVRSVPRVYSTCSINACWNSGGQKCGQSSNSASKYRDIFRNSSNCTTGYIGKSFSGTTNPCSTNGAGVCYRFAGTWSTWTSPPPDASQMYFKNFPGASCVYFGGPVPPNNSTQVFNGTVVQCAWNTNGACGTTLGGPPGLSVVVYAITSTGCTTNGTGTCYRADFFGSGYDPVGNANNCNRINYYYATQCTYYAN